MPRTIAIVHSMKQSANVTFRIQCKLRKYMIPRIKEPKNIPVIINNFNRLEYLKKLIDWLENAEMKNIFIIDNASTYKPLIDYYSSIRYTIFKLNNNVGHLALWKTHIFKYFEKDYYIYTDPDILPTKECPANITSYFISILHKFPSIGKVGLSLKIDDLPEHFVNKSKVIEWEQQYWQHEISPGIFDAKVDTTFALYRPGTKGGWYLPSVRTGFPYVARHLPWYIDSSNPDEEEVYYMNQIHGSSSWYKRQSIYEQS